MRRWTLGLTIAASGVLVLICLTSQRVTAQTQTSRLVNAADSFLATLSATQRQKVLYQFDDAAQRTRWSNFPIAVVPRGGLALKDLNEAQRAAAMRLLAEALSRRGFEKVQQIMEGDEVLKSQPDNGPPGANGPPRGGAGNGPPQQRNPNGPPPGPNRGPPPGGGPPPFAHDGPLFGKDLYYISFMGKPSATTPWMLQFGGHHLAVNITIADRRGILTPTLTGAQPALYTLNGKTVRPLGNENDKAFVLLASLSESQRRHAVLNYQVADLVLGPGEDGKTIQPEGLKAADMSEPQRTMLLDLISEWSGIVQEDSAAARMAEIKSGMADTWFAWSGPTTVAPGENGTVYYRIQGPKLVIEYAPQHGDSLHIHTMYRDPTNDYGRAVIQK